MPLPTSIETALLTLLKDFLESECLPYHDDTLADSITWDYYKDIHSPAMNPKGAVWISRVIPSPTADLERLDLIYSFEFRLLVSNSSDLELRKSLFDWQSLLFQMIKKIQNNGISGAVNGIQIRKFLLGFQLIESKVSPYINQDNGGSGVILLRYRWKLIESCG